ncbi:glycosyltransferase (activator-dependent family) [Nocardiopsis sp. Huas11]|uniref:activator-dependent family glycosyltransferase n=1 Tax=Nocardiopsis sp. Huas11 TaxID=2183912 RepID=UPI000EADFC13|nr:activator-dependent family glycosyltransferase [Nocardiopsis sp. Huas11]RKS06870.1 glycosyltransferase (activator-dependent family) [Nocardiopsis sp. Huas11]
MRVLIASVAERSHFLNLVPLGWALRSAGHEVLVASQPALEPVVRATGLSYVSVGRDHQLRRVMRTRHRAAPGELGEFTMTEDRPEVLTWEYLLGGLKKTVTWWWRMVNEPMADDLVDLCRAWRPDLVVWEPTTFSAAIAAEACEARHVRYLWGADDFGCTRDRFLSQWAERPEDEREDPLADWLTRIAGRNGVDYSETLVTGHATVEQVPPDLRLPTPESIRYLPVRYVPYNGRAALPHWLRTPPDRPRIGLSLGTSVNDWYGDREIDLSEVLEGLAELDAEVVATLPAAERERLGTTPPNTRLVEYTPVHALAPTCAAMITQGGPGTTLTALSHGVPQLLTPSTTMFDQVRTSRLVERAGAGRLLAPDQVTAQSVEREVRLLLEDARHTAAAGDVRDRMAAMPAPADLARTLTSPD